MGERERRRAGVTKWKQFSGVRWRVVYRCSVPNIHVYGLHMSFECVYFSTFPFSFGEHIFGGKIARWQWNSQHYKHTFSVATAVAAMNHLNKTMQNAETTVSLWFPQNMHFHLRNDIIHTHTHTRIEKCQMYNVCIRWVWRCFDGWHLLQFVTTTSHFVLLFVHSHTCALFAVCLFPFPSFMVSAVEFVTSNNAINKLSAGIRAPSIFQYPPFGCTYLCLCMYWPTRNKWLW